MFSTAFLLAASMVVSGQATSPEISQQAKAELDFLVGTWTIEGRVGDQKFQGEQQVKWAPGKHCLIENWTGALGEMKVHGTAVIGWEVDEGQIVDTGFIDTVGHRTIRWTVANDKVWEGRMRGFLLGKKAETAVRLEKKSPRQFVVVFEAAGDMPENEYVFNKVVKPRSTERSKKLKQ
jgi:hypothetical protein